MSEAQLRTDATGIDHSLSAFRQTILAVLSEEARYGLAVKRELEDYYGSDVDHGRVYSNLNDLVGMDLVEKRALDKRTNEYALTEDGHDAILNQLSWTFSRFVTDDARADELHALVDEAQQ